MAPTRPNPQDDLAPHWNWGRALPAPGRMGVDFETRVDFRRLQRYRLARAQEALRNSECGALLLFDVNNIRYVCGTKIGEWERDKLLPVRAADRAAASRSSGTSARPRCITGSIATGSTRPTAAPACSACAARSRRASV